MSGDIASSVRAVSSSVSPLTTLDPAVVMPRVSALSRFSASSNDMRVRVLGSKNRLMMVRPRSVGTFLIGRVPTSFMAEAVCEHELDFRRAQPLDPEQMARLQRGRGCDGHPSTSTSSRPSISARRTCTLCCREVGILRPT